MSTQKSLGYMLLMNGDPQVIARPNRPWLLGTSYRKATVFATRREAMNLMRREITRIKKDVDNPRRQNWIDSFQLVRLESRR